MSIPVSQGSDRGFFEIVGEQLEQVRRFMAEQLVISVEPVNEMLGHVASRQGKMLRSGLLLLSGQMCGGVSAEHIEVGGIVELIHTATLLHDDVIDEASSRRGAGTVNTLWGNESAVLLGDYVLSKAFVAGSALESDEIVKVLSATAVKICSGEILQNIQRWNWELTEEQYFEIIAGKTAELFSCSCYLGGLISGSGKNHLEQLADFGRNIGMSFQVTDDILDIVGDERRAGKTLGSDLAKQKITLPVIHFLGSLEGDKKSEMIERLSQGIEKVELVSLLQEAGSIEHACEAARRFSNDAKASLGGFEDCAAKDCLLEAADYVAGRCGG